MIPMRGAFFMSDASSGSDRDPVDRLAEEFLERRRRGEVPSLTEYVRRYPELAAEIREVFPALVLLDQADPAGSELARSREKKPGSTAAGVPEQLGDFRILREVGRGGMGVVYEAEQLSLGRRVALKVLPPQAQADARFLRRFEREAKAAARLHHTNIVPVFGVGVHQGTYYYAMQYIQGKALNEVLAELKRLRDGQADTASHDRPTGSAPVSAREVARSLLTGQAVPAAEAAPSTANELPKPRPGPAETPRPASGSASLPGQGESGSSRTQPAYGRSVARVGLQVAEALAYAHAEGVLHRDIKPSNLLLDARGHVWVADFGLAKTSDGDDLTHTGDVVGTVRYMAPERFQGQADARSDVCALGLTLYELAALAPAYPETDRHKLIQQVTNAEPAHLRRVAPALPRDLATIIHKAIDKDPDRRYASAAALAEDLQRFLDDRPIRARPPGPVELFERWCRRNPVVVGLLAAVVLVTALGFTGVVVQWQTAVANEDVANKRRDEIQRVNTELVESREKLRRTLYISDLRQIPTTWEKGDLRAVLYLLERQVPRNGEKDLRHFEWHYWNRLCHPESEVELEGATAGSKVAFNLTTTPGFSPDGSVLAGLEGNGNRGIFFVWDTRTGKVRLACQGPVPAGKEPVASVRLNHHSQAFSPDSKRLAACFSIRPLQKPGGPVRHELWVWDVATGRKLWHSPVKDMPTCLAFHPNGSHLAAAAVDGAGKKMFINVWDTATGKPLLELPGYNMPPVYTSRVVAFSPDGKRLLAPSNRLLVWDSASGQELPSIPGPSEHVLPAAFSFSQGGERLAVVWQTSAPVASVSATVSAVWFHDPATGKPLSLLPTQGGGGHVSKVHLSPDGNSLLTFSIDGPIKLWDTTTRTLVPNLPRFRTLAAIDFDASGGVLTAERSGVIKRWDLTDRPHALRFGFPFQQLRGRPLLSADGRRLAAAFKVKAAPGKGGLGTEIRVTETATGAQLFSLQSAAGFEAFVLSANGKRLLVAQPDPADGKKRQAVAWDVETGKHLATFSVVAPRYNRFQLILSPDGNRAAAVIASQVLYVWDVPTAKELFHPPLHVVNSVRLSPDGNRITFATGRVDLSGTPVFHLRDLQTGKDLWTRPGEGASAFSPDGRRIATCLWMQERSELLVLDAATGEKRLRLEDAVGLGNSILFSPDGRRIVTFGRDVRFWDAETGEEVMTLDRSVGMFPRQSPDDQIQFTPDGHRLITLCWIPGLLSSDSRKVIQPAGYIVQLLNATPLPESRKGPASGP
jgi:serine/threonine protein kinase/WD40 repeat protein